jgi:hypothetical protein
MKQDLVLGPDQKILSGNGKGDLKKVPTVMGDPHLRGNHSSFYSQNRHHSNRSGGEGYFTKIEKHHPLLKFSF